jgi:glycerophosphoryl diester phosphodiesterase
MKFPNLTHSMKSINLYLMAILFFSACSKSGAEPEPTKPEVPGTVISSKIVAHRGAWKEFNLPDNSLAAFEKALSLKFLGSECDIQITKDKKVIIYHDETISGSFIKDLNYDEIVAKHKLANGENVPLLSTFLSKLKADGGNSLLWLDVKSLSDAAGGNSQSILSAQEAAKEINAAGVSAKIKFIVGRKAVLDAAIAAAAGKWECGYMNAEYTADQFEKAGYSWANLTFETFYTSTSTNTTLFNSYTTKGIKLSVYTVDDVAAAKWFLAQKNLYAISTNIPMTLSSLN